MKTLLHKISRLVQQKNSFFLGFLFGAILAITRLDIGLFFLVFVSFFPLYLFLDGTPSLREILKFSGAMSTAYTLIGLHWIIVALHYISIWTTLLYFLMIPLFMSYFFMTIFMMKSNWKPKHWSRHIVLLLCWLTFESWTHFGEFRFPWFHLGYCLSPSVTLMQIVDIAGMLGATFTILLINIFFIAAAENKTKRKLFFSLGGLLFLLWIGYGTYRLQTIKLQPKPDHFAVVQANIKQDKKWDTTFKDTIFARHETLTLKAQKQGANLAIWSESSIPDFLPKRYYSKMRLMKFALKNDMNIFLGFQNYKKNKASDNNPYAFYNACSLLTQDGKLKTPYYKQFLVPFGERMPFLDIFPFLWKINFGQANFEYGKSEKIYQCGETKISPLICFEIAFPELITKIESDSVDVFVNLTNDAWFRKSVGTYQHSEMTRFRAIEVRKQFFRAANTGISMIINPLGQVQKKIPLYQKDVVSETVVCANTTTLYAQYFSKIESYLALLLAMVYSVLFFWHKKGTKR